MREKEDELALFLEIAAMNRSFRAEETGFARRKPPERTGSLRSSVMGEKEDELALFLEMRKREKERNSLLNNSDEFDAPLVSLKPAPARGPVRVRSVGIGQVFPATIEGHQHPTSTHEKVNLVAELESSGSRFSDQRWKNGTWDLSMFLKRGKIDWHAVISAEAKRRRYLELWPEEARNQEPVMFRSSIIPWWAWITHSHLSEAELLNGRAAMVGFFMSYLVDGLTGVDVVGQTGNFVCKVALFVTVIGVVLFMRRDDLDNLQKLADEATFYDKQWQASWKDQKN